MEPKKLLINRDDYDLFLVGAKTAVVRLGDRTKGLKVGERVRFSTNDGSHESALIDITNIYAKHLHSIDEEEAKAIGDYNVEDAIEDVTTAYTKLGRDVTPTSIVTIIWFQRAAP